MFRFFVAMTLVLFGLTATSQAGPIIGGSNLLTTADQHQLESWLGEGGLTLTNIFSKKAGDGKQSQEFHAAADGKGRTFTVIEVIQDVNGPRQIIGGYNPKSWSTNGDNITDISDRTAFLFNLTFGVKQDQRLDGLGQYQTLNVMSYGPTFGGGHDIYTDGSLETGYSNPYSYGNGGNLVGGLYYYGIGSIEVFSISNDSPVSAVPEPASMSLLAAGALGMLGYRMRKRKA